VIDIHRSPLRTSSVRRVLYQGEWEVARVSAPLIFCIALSRLGFVTRWSRSARPGSSPKSYRFRLGQGCHDVIQAIYRVVRDKNPKRLWILGADLQRARTVSITSSFSATRLIPRMG
jgi:hypothetical protein